uniref:Uncharacterized protein n=1 Tax=viral metagenome TaxID=1070528 RepID=A0A6M3IFG9_9ZZZZ
MKKPKKSNEFKKRSDIETLEKARQKLIRAKELVEKVFPRNNDVNDYFIDRITILTNKEHGFLTNDLNIDDLIEKIERR